MHGRDWEFLAVQEIVDGVALTVVVAKYECATGGHVGDEVKQSLHLLILVDPDHLRGAFSKAIQWWAAQWANLLHDIGMDRA